MADFFKVIAPTFHAEGGFQKRTDDPGNYCDGQLIGTMRGIAAQTYKQYRYVKYKIWRCPTEAEMRGITPEIATDIFYELFWKALINGNKIKDQYVAFICFQAAIGAVSNLSLLRKSINKVGSKYGKAAIVETPTAFNDYTVEIINSLPAKELFLQIYNDYLVYLRYIDRTYYNNANAGWYTRMQLIYDGAMKAYKFIKENPGVSALSVAFFLPSDYLDTKPCLLHPDQLKNPENIA